MALKLVDFTVYMRHRFLAYELREEIIAVLGCSKLVAVNAWQERDQARVASGKRLSGHDIGRSDYVEAEIRVYSLVGVIVASVSNPDSQVGGSLLPDLYPVKLITMNEHGMVCKSEKRPQGDAGPAYIQEWS